MRTGGHPDTITECRLFAAPFMLSRTIFMEHAPGLIHVHDDTSDLEAVYRLVSDADGVADYLFDHLV